MIVAGRHIPSDLVVEDGRIAEVGSFASRIVGFCGIRLRGPPGDRIRRRRLLGPAPEDYSTVGSALAASGVNACQRTFVSSPMVGVRGRCSRAVTEALEVRKGPRRSPHCGRSGGRS